MAHMVEWGQWESYQEWEETGEITTPCCSDPNCSNCGGAGSVTETVGQWVTKQRWVTNLVECPG